MLRRRTYTPPRVQLSIISDDDVLPAYEAPKPSEPPMKRFLKWPYYRPPDGWVLHPGWDLHRHPPKWTAFVSPTSPAGRVGQLPGRARVTVNGSPESVYMPLPSGGMPVVKKLQHADPSPFFAQVPPQGASDPGFVAYRIAQAASPTSHKHPILHPIISHYPDQTTPSICLDLSDTAPPSLPSLLASAYVPLYPEELQTFLTHPPVRTLRLVFAGMPAIRHTLSVPEPGGIILQTFIFALVAWALRPLRTDEWAALDKPARERARTVHQRRAGQRRTTARIAAGETPYRVSDTLGENTIFLALERMRGRTDGGEDVYLVHTTSRARWVPWR